MDFMKTFLLSVTVLFCFAVLSQAAIARAATTQSAGGEPDPGTISLTASQQAAFSGEVINLTATLTAPSDQGIQWLHNIPILFSEPTSNFSVQKSTEAGDQATADWTAAKPSNGNSVTITAAVKGGKQSEFDPRRDSVEVTITDGDVALEADPTVLARKDGASTTLTARVRNPDDAQVTFQEANFNPDPVARQTADDGTAQTTYTDFTVAGSYEFSADYQGETSNTVKVLAVDARFTDAGNNETLLWYQQAKAREFNVLVTPDEGKGHVGFRFTGQDADKFSVTRNAGPTNMLSVTIQGVRAGHYNAKLEAVLTTDDGTEVLDSFNVEQITIENPEATSLVNGDSVSVAFRATPGDAQLTHNLSVTNQDKGSINDSEITFVSNGTEAAFPNNSATTDVTVQGTVSVNSVSTNVSHSLTLKNSPPEVTVLRRPGQPPWNTGTFQVSGKIKIKDRDSPASSLALSSVALEELRVADDNTQASIATSSNVTNQGHDDDMGTNMQESDITVTVSSHAAEGWYRYIKDVGFSANSSVEVDAIIAGATVGAGVSGTVRISAPADVVDFADEAFTGSYERPDADSENRSDTKYQAAISAVVSAFSGAQGFSKVKLKIYAQATDGSGAAANLIDDDDFEHNEKLEFTSTDANTPENDSQKKALVNVEPFEAGSSN